MVLIVNLKGKLLEKTIFYELEIDEATDLTDFQNIFRHLQKGGFNTSLS